MSIISPSILSADPLNLQRDITEVENGGADWHHIDVMDGHFVPNLSFGLPLISSLKRFCSLPLDVHLMIQNPENMIPEYIKAGANFVTFHVETTAHSHRLVQSIKEKGVKAGVAINPGTPIQHLDPLLSDVDLILVMSVNPGFGGQEFIQQSCERVGTLADKLKEIGRYNDVIIQVDGGINETTIQKVYDSGAKAFVAGSYIYGAKDRSKVIQKLKELTV
ncbi:MAG: ribulose-phosphate 3-epimerase [Oligoflexales bacterium]